MVTNKENIRITNVSMRQGQVLFLDIRLWQPGNPSCVTFTWLPQRLGLISALGELLWTRAREVAPQWLFFLEWAQQKVIFKDIIHVWKITLQKQVQNKYYAIGVNFTVSTDLWLVSRSNTAERSGLSSRTLTVCHITQFHSLLPPDW